IAEGDRVWFRLTVRGTHTGDFHGLTPTGKKITITTVDILASFHLQYRWPRNYAVCGNAYKLTSVLCQG
ncbi:MAG: ester cyclase, partial [Candidatus Bathyarchaeota archaeon]|nr:ester cyclase [Candidatus Bathyarchaeota archaeon]